ncbi:MAG TPA: hypothetical protein VFC82_08745 [Actinomycetaceae bacterium]|nr:hypothetical protein [Actinomycetaceae bacterium]
MDKYYYNLRTGKVEQGRTADIFNRMGPYNTYEEAALALETAREHSEMYDHQTKEWKEEWEDKDEDKEEEEHDSGWF